MDVLAKQLERNSQLTRTGLNKHNNLAGSKNKLKSV